ncbi:hypothetical protein ACQ4PT_050590 [Festuca glaucescens]
MSNSLLIVYIPKENAQLEDCVAVGLILQQISNELKLRMPQLIFTLIDDLASTLMASDVASLHTVKEIALKQIFFWEPRRRRIFWIHDVPKALENHAADLIIRTHGWILPWNSRIHQGLLNEMNAYRRDEEERKNGGVKVKPEVYKYNVHDPLQYVKCISGAYTHADKLKARVGKILDNFGFEVTVDEAVQENDPELFIVLYKLLRGRILLLSMLIRMTIGLVVARLQGRRRTGIILRMPGAPPALQPGDNKSYAIFFPC